MNALRAGRLDHLHRLPAKEGHARQVSAHLRLGVRLLRIAVLCLELGLGFVSIVAWPRSVAVPLIWPVRSTTFLH